MYRITVLYYTHRRYSTVIIYNHGMTGTVNISISQYHKTSRNSPITKILKVNFHIYMLFGATHKKKRGKWGRSDRIRKKKDRPRGNRSVRNKYETGMKKAKVCVKSKH
jgi:hypothetical protein